MKGDDLPRKALRVGAFGVLAVPGGGGLGAGGNAGPKSRGDAAAGGQAALITRAACDGTAQS
jgi:hypothetical protein